MSRDGRHSAATRHGCKELLNTVLKNSLLEYCEVVGTPKARIVGLALGSNREKVLRNYCEGDTNAKTLDKQSQKSGARRWFQEREARPFQKWEGALRFETVLALLRQSTGQYSLAITFGH